MRRQMRPGLTQNGRPPSPGPGSERGGNVCLLEPKAVVDRGVFAQGGTDVFRSLTMAPAKKSTRSMSAQHKAALAVGRSEGRAVRNYLEALEAHKPKRGRRRTPESISARLEKIEADLDEAE